MTPDSRGGFPIMKKSLLFAACVLLAACQSSSISGTVTFEGEGDASGVVVSLVSAKKTEMVITEATGAYKFQGVEDGTYQLTFAAPESTESRKALAVILKDGKGGEVPAVTLLGAGVVSGKVTAGAPTGNLGIQVSVAGTTLSAMTADDGSFTLEHVPTGQRTLVATRGNYISSSTVTVQRGVRNAAEFTLGKQGVRAGKVTGSVQYWDARAASDIQLSVPGVLEPTNAAANGAFSLTLPEGEWDIVATSPAYPRQVVAHAKVSADGTTEVGIRKLSAYHRFSVKDPSQYQAYSRLFDDGVHALVSREGWENLTHSIVDLRTGEERMFLVEWNWVDDPTRWTATANGQFLAYGQNWGLYDPDYSWHQHSEFNIFNTTTAQHVTFRGDRDTNPTSEELWSFSATGEFFFGIDTLNLHRLKTADGTVTSVPADYSVMKGDDEHFLALAYGPEGSTVGSATFLDSQTNKVVVPNVDLTASSEQFGQYGMLMTDCDGSSNCDVKVVNLMNGAVATVTGGKYYQSSALQPTNHPDWARIEGNGKNAYVHLTDGTATAYPSGYTTDVADSAKINSSGTRVAFQVYGSNYSLYMTAMPPTAVPATATASGSTVSYNYAWLSETRFVASTSTGATSFIDQKADTVANVSDVVADSIMISEISAVYRRTSDKALMALVGDAPPIQLSDADPNSSISVRHPYPWMNEYSVFQTKDKSWTVWTLVNESNARSTSVVLKNGTTTPKRFPDVVRDSDGGVSATGFIAYLYNWDGQEVAIDLETGVMKQLWETDVDDWNYGVSGPKVGSEYLMLTTLSGRSTQLYNGSNGNRSVYETALLKY
jgi:hypothetical protein